MSKDAKRILVTGCAGFIASKITEQLIATGQQVVGLDNMNLAYPVELKQWRLAKLKKLSGFTFMLSDVTNFNGLKEIFESYSLTSVVNLAAYAGVRPSVENPWIYMETNLTGTLNLLELCKTFNVSKFLLASTSSLYGQNPTPFQESQTTDGPLSPYAASKKSAEALAYTYHYLHGIDVSIPRYFTVYGPAGRPDMAVFKFIHHIAEGLPIPVYGDGRQKRDFTYVDDIAAGSVSALKTDGFEVFNLGSDHPVELNYLISLIEKYLNKTAEIQFLTPHRADAPVTWAQIDKAKSLLNWEAKVSIEEGIKNSVEWYLENRNWIVDMQQKENQSVKE